MKQDLDRLMEERGLDAALVAGHLHGNPAMIYMLNGAAVSQGYVLKKRGDKPVFFCSSIEREEAIASGLRVVNLNKFDYLSILGETGDRLAADGVTAATPDAVSRLRFSRSTARSRVLW